MWPAFVIAVLFGLSAGYWVGKNFAAGKSALDDAEDTVQNLNTELAQAKNTQKLLEQENADLKYQLGEEKKARAYAESRNS